jgi:hypothetical protein
MGVITIEVPQKIQETYKIDSEKKAKEIIDSLGRLARKKKLRDLGDVVGLWADRTESAQEIARELRQRSNLGRRNG